MVSQYKTVSIFILFIFLFFYSVPVKTQQLALPKKKLDMISEHKITVKEFVARYSDCLISSSIKDNIITRRFVINNTIREYPLLDNITLSIINKIEFINNQSHLHGILNIESFLFQLTNLSHKINEEKYDKTKPSKLIGKLLQQHDEPFKFNT